jgi:hypothetical protein
MLELPVAEAAVRGTDEGRSSGLPPPVWYQLIIEGPRAELSPLTRAGSDPFDYDQTGRCSLGHVVGLNLLSEATLYKAGLPDADLIETAQMVGVRRGLLRPRPLLLVSQRVLGVVEAATIRGLNIEVARLA